MREDEALREALANALIHSDYYERRGVVIEKKRNAIIISNPGSMRIPKDEAMNGGISDPQNSALFLMFSLIGIGERAGSGLMNIETTWKDINLLAPVITEQFNPDRIILTLQIPEEDVGVNVGVKLTETEKKVFESLEKNGKLTVVELSELVGKDSRTIERGLKKLRENNMIERIGSDKSGEWKIIV